MFIIPDSPVRTSVGVSSVANSVSRVSPGLTVRGITINKLIVTGILQRDKRDSNIVDNDFNATSASINAQFLF